MYLNYLIKLYIEITATVLQRKQCFFYVVHTYKGNSAQTKLPELYFPSLIFSKILKLLMVLLLLIYYIKFIVLLSLNKLSKQKHFKEKEFLQASLGHKQQTCLTYLTR